MRKRYRQKEDDLFPQLISGIFAAYAFYLILLYFSDRSNFWKWCIYGVIIVIATIAAIFLWGKIKNNLKQKHLDSIVGKLKGSGQEEYLQNFISRFGLEDGKGNGWEFRNHRFSWDRINDLKKIFLEKEIISKEDDVFQLLRFYIQEKEETLTRESIHRETQKLEHLSGNDFEKLLYRLFEKMAYKVELIGHTGDQGGDLIANKDGERILIQAKCYRDWSTGNAAVQQVVGAIKFYNCNKAMVVTTSHFTVEAIALAKANNVELVSKNQLQELLLKYLGESWV